MDYSFLTTDISYEVDRDTDLVMSTTCMKAQSEFLFSRTLGYVTRPWYTILRQFVSPEFFMCYRNHSPRECTQRTEYSWIGILWVKGNSETMIWSKIGVPTELSWPVISWRLHGSVHWQAKSMLTCNRNSRGFGVLEYSAVVFKTLLIFKILNSSPWREKF